MLLLKLIAWLRIMTTCNITLHFTRSYLIWRIRDILLKHLTQYVLHFILCPKVKFKMYNFPFILHLGGAQIMLKLIFNFKLFFSLRYECWKWWKPTLVEEIKINDSKPLPPHPRHKNNLQPTVITKIVTILGLP